MSIERGGLRRRLRRRRLRRRRRRIVSGRMVAFMTSVSWVLLMNFAADLLYGLADPRITYS